MGLKSGLCQEMKKSSSLVKDLPEGSLSPCMAREQTALMECQNHPKIILLSLN